MRYLLGLAAGLITLWLLLSGHYAVLTLSLGALSIIFILWLSSRLELIHAESVPLALLPRMPSFLAWLFVQVVRSNIDVCWRILRGPAATSPSLVRIRVRDHTPLGRTILANAITLTPGTVTIGLEGENAVVHAFTEDGAQDIRDGTMAKRVAQLEGGAG